VSRWPARSAFMARVSRSSFVTLLVVLALLAALPHSIHRLIKTGHVYLFSKLFFSHMLARLSGPGRVRFLIQPSMAIGLGARDGAKDARAGAGPFLFDLIHHSQNRGQLVRGAMASIGELIWIAILLDLISQILLFRDVYVAGALVLGPVLIAMPYAVSRALSHRVIRWRNSRRNGRRPEWRRAA
jgi:hypothetical protein